MAWESKSARQRQNSASSRNLPIHTRQPSQAAAAKAPRIEPKSSHTSDPFLQDFLDPNFDPAAFLNASLPPLQHGSSRGTGGAPAVPLADVSNEAQILLSQLNAHTTRLTGTLTQLTDDILRSGSRLAYEVELLRGETLSFADTMNETLQDEIKMFLPNGLPEPQPRRRASTTTPAATPKTESAPTFEGAPAEGDAQVSADPAYIKQLRTLTLVRARLDSVIKTFGDAMEFVFPPSEVSVGSGFLSVSAPEPGAGSFGSAGGEQHSTEDKGQQVLKQLREEVSQLLRSGRDKDGNEDAVAGIERAAERVEQLKELTAVWKGTAEEKGRAKFIESLARMVEDRHKELLREVEAAARREGAAAETTGRPRKGSVKAAKAEEARTVPGGYGLMSQLQKLRSGI
jgi:hypothetical protein